MANSFHLERVGVEDISHESHVSGYGLLALFTCEVEYHFSLEEISLEAAEQYIQGVLNHLPDDTIDDLCQKAWEWKTEKMSSDTVDYPDGLAEAHGRELLNYMAVGDVHLYRNPYDRNDPRLGAILSGGTEWDSENGMEIVVRDNKVLEVREYLGYGEFAIWDESEEIRIDS